eukprot:scaffold2841_cov74-Cyclotella_meneghiniana.AAC.3
MKPSSISFLCSLITTLAAAAPRRINHISSFIPPSNPRQRVVKIKPADPLLIRGGQQKGVTSTTSHHAIFESASPFIQYNSILASINLVGLDLPLRVQISSIAVILWSVKLASFLFFRACKVKTDTRLDGLLSTVSGTSELLM